MCISTIPAPAPLTTASIRSSRAPVTSLTMQAPASSAAAATSGLRVSTEMGIVSAAASRLITGTTRSRSSSAGTASAPGRVDSPPTSITSAPSAAIARPRSAAASGSRYRPPSENESGVTLSTPMTSVRSPHTISLSPQRQISLLTRAS